MEEKKDRLAIRAEEHGSKLEKAESESWKLEAGQELRLSMDYSVLREAERAAIYQKRRDRAAAEKSETVFRHAQGSAKQSV